MNQGAIFESIPEKIGTEARYLFYLHGQIIEALGVQPTHPDWGVYEYENILEAFKAKGFVVISEPRPKDTDVKDYAQKVAGQVQELLKAGVPPGKITVVGASKGAIIAMMASTFLKKKHLNFVTIAACNDWVFANYEFNLFGNVLSIYESSDLRNGSCEREYFNRSEGINQFKEVKVNTGLGHGVLYRPLEEWFGPTVDWANRH